MRINDRLLDALADRWPNITPDWTGQTFEAWLDRRLDYFNELGYPKPNQTLWFENFPESLWDIVTQVPPADSDAFLRRECEELRAVGGTLIKRVVDLRPLVKLMLSM